MLTYRARCSQSGRQHYSIDSVTRVFLGFICISVRLVVVDTNPQGLFVCS